MNLSELLVALPNTKTQLQLENEIKKFIGRDIEIAGTISNITSLIHLKEPFGTCSILIRYDKDKFASHLINFSKNSKVTIIAKLNKTDISVSRVDYFFDLISIKRQD